MRRFLVVCVWIGILLILFPSITFAYSPAMNASVVVPQPDFVTGTGGASTLNTPSGARTGNGKLIVPDNGNHRVLIWNSIPTTNGVGPDVVIGQADFTHISSNQGTGRNANTLASPSGSFFDGTRLYIGDVSNNRVLIFNSIPNQNNASAAVVVGQASFTTADSSVLANRMNAPRGVFVDSVTGKMAVADGNNNRVLIFNSVPTTNNVSADVVIGQADFTHNLANQGNGTVAAANTLSAPREVIITPDGKLLISDMTNHRVIIYNSIPTINNASADVVIGQTNFISSSLNQGGGVNAGTLSSPWGLWYDSGRLYIADQGNSRVLIFNSIPTTNGAWADSVVGQPDLTSNNAVTTINGMACDRGVFVANNQMFVSDGCNSRIIIYNNNFITPFINITTPLVDIGSGRYRLTGNVTLNKNNSTYALERLSFDVNGTDNGNASITSGRDDGGGNTITDFTYDFDPTVGGGSINNLTIKILATTYNNDTNSLFYFLPFKFTGFNVSSTKSQSFSFSVNKAQLQRIKDNLDHFEVWYKPNTTTGKWTQYISNIPDTQIDQNGLVIATKTSNLIKFIGSYIFKIQAVDNWNNRQDSNYLYTAGTIFPVRTTSFTKNFAPLPTPTATPITSFGTIAPIYSPTPYIVPTQMPIELENTGGDLKQYLIFIVPIAAALLLILLILRRRRRVKV